MTTNLSKSENRGRQKFDLLTSVRSKKATETLIELEAHLEQFQVTGILDITLPGLEEIPVYQIFRKEHRSGYFNYGKGFDHTVAKVPD